FFGDHSWVTEEKIASEKWATTYNLNSSNGGYFGRIIFQELDDIGQEDPAYKVEYDLMHILLWRANFQSLSVTPSLDTPFFPAFGWFHAGGANKFPHGSFDSFVLARGSTTIYTYVRQEYFGDVIHRVYSSGGIIWSSTNSNLFLHSGARKTETGNTIAIMNDVTTFDKYYLDADGTLSPPVERFETTSDRYAFHLNGIYYWTNILVSGGSSYFNYYEAPGGSRTDLEKVLGPDLQQWGVNLIHPRNVSIRTYR
ncbi:hypothetical protein KAR91_79720, partial [Candidatus Pacearchaeota archaeon]|nr:hypothetical protein [Candidatus Pacearchaeota archaeon]